MTTTTTDPGLAPVSEVRGVKLHELRAMVDAARAIGARRLRIGEIEVEVAPVEAEPPNLSPAEAARLAEDVFGKMPDENDLLHWSVPGPLPSEASKA